MARLNNRVLKHKEIILAEIAKGYKLSEIARVIEIDTRTIKRALAIWEKESIQAELKLVKAALEDSLK